MSPTIGLSSPCAGAAMCRNIRTLFNFEPPATEIEIRDASLQFVRKLSGFSVPSKANEEAFERAVDAVAPPPASSRPFCKPIKPPRRPLHQPCLTSSDLRPTAPMDDLTMTTRQRI